MIIPRVVRLVQDLIAKDMVQGTRIGAAPIRGKALWADLEHHPGDMEEGFGRGEVSGNAPPQGDAMPVSIDRPITLRPLALHCDALRNIALDRVAPTDRKRAEAHETHDLRGLFAIIAQGTHVFIQDKRAGATPKAAVA